jgi:hypothetical protein
MSVHQRTAIVLLALLCGGVFGCDRRDDPSVDGDSKAVGSPPGEIVDPGPTASAQADRMPRYRTPDRPACADEGRDACNESGQAREQPRTQQAGDVIGRDQ